MRGFIDHMPASDLAAFLEQAVNSLAGEITLRLVDSDGTLRIPVEALKALFFVKSFEGRSDYREVKFFDKNPPIKGLWVRVQFFDHESLEGIVQNSIDFLIKPGFFLKPPDPASNNAILYVVKSSLADFRVLGVHTDY